MAAKVQKLQGQFDAGDSAHDVKQLSSIFSGVAIFVNGYTSECIRLVTKTKYGNLVSNSCAHTSIVKFYSPLKFHIALFYLCNSTYQHT